MRHNNHLSSLLFYAIEQGGDYNVFRFLLENNADPSFINEKGESPIQLIRRMLQCDPENQELARIFDIMKQAVAYNPPTYMPYTSTPSYPQFHGPRIIHPEQTMEQYINSEAEISLGEEYSPEVGSSEEEVPINRVPTHKYGTRSKGYVINH